MLTKLGEEIETLVDRYGATYLLHQFSTVCYEKSEHIQINWQDDNLAREWRTLADKLARLYSETRSI